MSLIWNWASAAPCWRNIRKAHPTQQPARALSVVSRQTEDSCNDLGVNEMHETGGGGGAVVSVWPGGEAGTHAGRAKERHGDGHRTRRETGRCRPGCDIAGLEDKIIGAVWEYVRTIRCVWAFIGSGWVSKYLPPLGKHVGRLYRKPATRRLTGTSPVVCG